MNWYCKLAMITPEIVSGLEFVLQSSGQTGWHASWFMQISHLPFHFPLEAGKGWVYIKTKSSQFYTFDVHLKKQKTAWDIFLSTKRGSSSLVLTMDTSHLSKRTQRFAAEIGLQ